LRIILKPEQENDNREALFVYLENTGLIDRIWKLFIYLFILSQRSCTRSAGY